MAWCISFCWKYTKQIQLFLSDNSKGISRLSFNKVLEIWAKKKQICLADLILILFTNIVLRNKFDHQLYAPDDVDIRNYYTSLMQSNKKTQGHTPFPLRKLKFIKQEAVINTHCSRINVMSLIFIFCWVFYGKLKKSKTIMIYLISYPELWAPFAINYVKKVMKIVSKPKQPCISLPILPSHPISSRSYYVSRPWSCENSHEVRQTMCTHRLTLVCNFLQACG